MPRIVSLSDLLPVKILFDADFHALATFMLRGFDSLTEGRGATSRPTVYGVASAYARLFVDVEFRRIEAKLRKMGFDLGATVEWDEGTAT